MKQITALYIDLFCGAGGTSSGVEYARLDGRKCAEVVACVNHDANAIRSHKANHPHTLHFTEDIRTLELSPMVKHLEKKHRQYPKAKVVLWASLECTNFSKAKGGPEKRMLAWLEKQGEQKHAWSEEDEEMFDAIIADIQFTQKAHNHEVNQVVYEREIDWLKTLKGRVQPQWKPSDEQLNALDEVYKTHSANGVCRRIIFRLLKQLKKL